MSDDESSGSDDIPLSALATKNDEESSDELEFDEEEENGDEEEEIGEEEPDTSDFIDDDDDEDDGDGDYASDSSDDAPLTSLKSKKTTPPKKAKAPVKKSSSSKKTAAKKKTTPAKKKKSAAKKKTKAKQSASSSTSNYLCASGELYSQCDKGKLIQSLLARWWYAYEWPDPKVLPDSTPEGYDALDGFPGVFICTRGSNVGKFLDVRDHAKSPSFKNFSKKNSKELQDMLLRAIKKQMKVLLEHEGGGTETEKGLKVLEKWAMKLNCAKADKQAVKVLKAKKLLLS